MISKIPLYQPDVQVTLYKTIKRTLLDGGSTKTSDRFKSVDPKIDLRPFLSETSGVHVTKSVREPAGAFSIALVDRPYTGSTNTLAGSNFETMYGILEPMDFIEIRMRHGVVPSGSPPPVVMRGFISTITRSEAMGADGRPVRNVTITGQDYGKLWQQMQIWYWTGYVLGQDVLSNFKLFSRFGVGLQTAQSGTGLVKEVVEKIFNPYLQTLMPENTTNPSVIMTDLIAAVPGVTDITGPQNRDGTIYDLFHYYLDVGPWNELFLEDREDGVHVVFRPNPYMSVDGEKIQPEAPDIDVIDLPDTDIMSMSVSRSDSHVANYYWTKSPLFDLNSDIYRQQAALSGDPKSINIENYQNAQAALYGIRVMKVDTQMGGDDITSMKSGQDKTAIASRDTGMANWINDRRLRLVEQNRDNVVFESGAMRVRGNENIRAGTYVNLRRGTFQARYYVVQVTHDYTPFQGFSSTLQVERGTGFIERAKRDGGASTPYLAEMSETK